MARDFKPKTDDQLEKTARTPEAFIFAQRLNALLASKNILQTELAEKTGITKQMIGGYMSGQKECGMNNLKRIATALDTTPDYLLGVTDTPSNTADVRTVCEILRLPQNVVESIIEWQADFKEMDRGDPSPLAEFLGSGEFDTIIKALNALSMPREKRVVSFSTAFIKQAIRGEYDTISADDAHTGKAIKALSLYMDRITKQAIEDYTQQINETDNQT